MQGTCGDPDRRSGGRVRTRSPTVRLHSEAVEGTAAKVLVQRSAAADLIVVGAHRRRSHLGLRLGRVAPTLLHHADCPVAVVPLAARSCETPRLTS
ncbi:universal stress protein [Streptomyces sp. NPDC057557]|uniref:universal stress protein n=1 Tax=Streptomyces sp. NPDC057557 TaxID=3346167 RepID=UPI0036D111DF